MCVGRQDNHGLPLRVLSVLARRDVDPWAEAASLSALPKESAIIELASCLDPLPLDASAAQVTKHTATRLIALLPARAGATLIGSRSSTEVVLGDRFVLSLYVSGFLIGIVLPLIFG